MAEAEITKPTIVNWALSEIGLAPKFSIDDQTKLGATVDIYWPRAVARCFGVHDWTFCRRTYLLTRQAATPVTGFRYGFDLPGDRIGLPMKYSEDPRSTRPVRNFRIEGTTVFVDVPTLYAVCKVPVDPVAWPPQFMDAFAKCLASYLCVPLLQDIELAGAKEKEAFGNAQEGGAGGMFGRLIAQERAGEPQGDNLLRDDPLTAGRFSGPWYGGN